jgi:HK97 family phage portal protein
MSLFNRENRDAALGNLADLLQLREGGLYNYTGEKVNEMSALGISSVLSAISLIADSISILPIKTIRYDGDKKVFTEKPKIFDKPNANQTIFEVIHQIITSLLMHGNSFVLIDRDRQGRPIAMTPLHSDRVTVEMNKGRKTYTIGTQSNKRILTDENILHFKWFSYPGDLIGVSPLRVNGNTYGLALAMERHISQFYGQGGTPSSILETDRDLTSEQAKFLQENWQLTHNRNRKPAVLTGGLKWKSISAGAGDELIQAREQIVNEVARIFRVPAHLINSKDGSNVYSNIESNGLAFIRHTLLPYIRRIEDELTTLLPGKQVIKLDTEEYARGDMFTRVRTYQVAISSGLMTPNEARNKLDLESYDGGDKFFLGLQGAPVDPAIQPLGSDAHDPKKDLLDPDNVDD